MFMIIKAERSGHLLVLLTLHFEAADNAVECGV